MYDEAVTEAFLKKQSKLFNEDVASIREEAEEFLEDVCAVVCENADEVKELLEDEMDISGISDDELLDIEEVFEVGDGRYLVVEG